MRILATVTACLLALLAAGCAGDEESAGNEPDAVLLDETSFQEVVAAELRGDEVEAEPASPFAVLARSGPNRVEVDLDDAYGRYRDAPGRRDEIVASVAAEARAALQEPASETPFAEARHDVVPLLKPRFELRTYGFEPAQTRFPAGLAVLYALDTRDRSVLVHPADVERWGTTRAELHALAVENLRRRTDAEDPLLCEPSNDELLCGWASGDGYDATRMIVPGLREQIEKELGGPAVYAVPMENVFVALSIDVLRERPTGRLFRLKVERDFQTSEDPLSPEVFVERGGELVVAP